MNLYYYGSGLLTQQHIFTLWPKKMSISVELYFEYLPSKNAKSTNKFACFVIFGEREKNNMFSAHVKILFKNFIAGWADEQGLVLRGVIYSDDLFFCFYIETSSKFP